MLKLFTDRKFRTQLILFTTILAVLTAAAVGWPAYRAASSNAQSLTQSLLNEVTAHAVAHTREFVSRAVPPLETLRELAEVGLALDDSDRLARQQLAVLDANPGFSWISYGDTQGNFTGAYRTTDGNLRLNQSSIVDGRTKLIERQRQSDGTFEVARRDDDFRYDPRERPFYQKAMPGNQVVWSDPYIFFGQGIPGISVSAPVRHANGTLRGVLSIDFDLQALSKFITQLKPSPRAEVILLTADGVVLAYPRPEDDERQAGAAETNLTQLRDLDSSLAESLRIAMQADAQGDFELIEIVRHDESYFAGLASLNVGGDQTWFVIAIAPQSDFLNEVWSSQRHAAAMGIAAMLVAVALSVVMARRISQPVQRLIDFMRRVGSGDLEARAELGGGREFAEVSSALNAMIADLRDRLRLRHSLDVAMQVQQRLLPSGPPSIAGIDLAGHSNYCDETGGDYYDFLIMDEPTKETVMFAIGDVMGHGVAAALVMAGARAVLRDRAAGAGSLAELLNRLNRLLAADLEGTRFMTMYLGLYDVRSRILRFASAGHDPAIVYDPATETFDEVDRGGMPLGITDDTEYDEYQIGPLDPGQTIVVGTDGVWEMQNVAGELFGKDRLREIIQSSSSASADVTMKALTAELARFQGDAKSNDDVTFLILKVAGDGRAGQTSSERAGASAWP